MSHGGGGDGEVEVNLIPMIDIVIQLITFFLMLINFDESNNNIRVRLPLADLAKPTEMEVEQVIFLNVLKDGVVDAGLGELYDCDSDKFRQHMLLEARESEKSMIRAGRKVEEVLGRKKLWTTVMIRADANVDYGKVQRMMKACQDQGFTKFALRATPPQKGRKNP